MLIFGITVLIALLLGWLAGMLTSKQASQWCQVDGSQLRCLECAKSRPQTTGPKTARGER